MSAHFEPELGIALGQPSGSLHALGSRQKPVYLPPSTSWVPLFGHIGIGTGGPHAGPQLSDVSAWHSGAHSESGGQFVG